MSLLQKILGADGTSILKVTSLFKSALVTPMPIDVGSRGAYSYGGITGILPAALGANSEVFQFRWSHATLVCIPRQLCISAAVSTTAFAAGVPVGIEARVARSWSGQGTGGTGITFGANDCKKRTDHAQSAMAAGDLRIATTAALGAGTKTLDGAAVAHVVWQPGTAVSHLDKVELLKRDTSDEPPFYFEQNEGIVVRSVEVPATGTWKLTAMMEWIEIERSLLTEWT